LSELIKQISLFEPISLSEMDSVKLMNRSDTKFVFSNLMLLQILPKLQGYYRVLEIENIRLSSYQSLYYDTEDFQFYHQHHNGKTNRNKVRYREYIDSGISFLEVKHKNNKGKTIKKRIPVNAIQEMLEGDNQSFVDEVIGEKLNLIPQHRNKFQRLTLVHKINKERLTIDINFQYQNTIKQGGVEQLVIAEVKQEKKSRFSDFIRIIKEAGVHPFRISKYCIATASLYPELKRNNFKRKFLHLNKI